MPSASAQLLSMPWTALGEPSLGLGVLRAALDAENIPCNVRHLNLFLLRYLRASTYLSFANTYALNDFIFSGVLEPAVSARQRRHMRSRVEEMLTLGLLDADRFGGCDGVCEELLHLRRDVIPVWLAEEANLIARSPATLVGFTCMFDQTVASLALARLVKEAAPEKLIAFGGYALRSPTGQAIMQSFPWVDAVCVGEGEQVIGPLARASAGEIPLGQVPGILLRSQGAVRMTLPPPPLQMDQSPTPNFDDYFSDLAELRDRHQVDIANDTLPFETARGCWWGQIKHCVFCGIADEDLTYRARSAGNVLAALSSLRERHGITSFRFSDYILPHQFHKTLLPALAERGAPYRLACEMKANSSPDHFRGMAAAGFAEVQPGIESFSSDVLRRMDKGVSAALNVQTLLLGRRFGIHIHYNLLYGLPDDQPAAYEEMINALPRLFHLDAPLTRTRIQITRYAPLQASPERFDIPVAQYEPAYEVIFSQEYLERSGFDLNAYCYYFQHPFENSASLQRLYHRLTLLVDTWKRLQNTRPVQLWFELDAGGMTVFDSRREPEGSLLRLDRETAQVYAASAKEITTGEKIATSLGLEVAAVEGHLRQLDEAGLIFRDGRSLIGLALPRSSYAGKEQPYTNRMWAVA